MMLAKKEHDRLFHKKLLLKKGKQNLNKLYSIFPPRSSWIRLSKKERRNKSALDINAIQLERTVLRETNKFKNKAKLEWQKNLYQFLNDLSIDVLSGEYEVPKPKIIAQFKEEKNGTKIFRPIANYTFEDRVIISQCNKYLTECFDTLFEPCSYAFRSTFIQKKSYSHHSAVENIIEYKNGFKDKALWVSECDIKKFYDCVNHEIIIQAFENKVNECKNKGLLIDITAKDLFISYLNSYSFNFDVKTIMLGDKKEFGWVTKKELEAVGSDPVKDKIGVPQGGALSCLIANILMDVVDKKVICENRDGNLFYARFCDDMVLIHPDKTRCGKVLKIYSDNLKEIKLLNHHFTEITEYSKGFWKSKSKAPYCWDSYTNSLKSKANVPWLSFVGYQVSNDLKIRVRKNSLRKEIEKQVRETGKVITVIKNGEDFRVSEKSIKRRLRQRLMSMSVGRKNVFDIHKKGRMCWTSGFRLLKNYPNVQFQTKYLDRKRASNLARLDKHLRKMNESQRPPTTRNAIKIEKEPDYYGSPFSYHFQFK